MSRINDHRIPVLEDNYSYLLEDPENQTAVVIDPAEAPPVIEYLEKVGLKPVEVWITHRHGDHTAGVAGVLKHFDQGMPVYASAEDRGQVPCQTHDLKEGDKVRFADDEGQILSTPGHVDGHISYYLPGSKNLFCGDVLFGVSCGKVNDGKFAEMYASVEKLRALPDDLQVWVGHEYTLNNLKFAAHVDPDNAEIARRQKEDKVPTIPLDFAVEKRTNPFLRVHEKLVQDFTGKSDPAAAFRELRERKDVFR